MSVTPAQNIIPSNPTDQEVILDAIKEADGYMIQRDSLQDKINDVIEELHEKYELNKGLIRKMMRTYHKQNFAKVEQESEDFLEAYEKIVK